MNTHGKRTDFDHRVYGNVIYAHDLNGNFTFLNHEGRQLLGYSREEVCGLNIAQVVAPEIAATVHQEITRSVTKRIGTVYEIEIIAKDGHRIQLEVSMRLASRQDKNIEIEGIAVPLYDDVSSDSLSCPDSDSYSQAESAVEEIRITN